VSTVGTRATDVLSVLEWQFCLRTESDTFVGALMERAARSGDLAAAGQHAAEAQRISQLIAEYHDSLRELGVRPEVATVAARQHAMQPVDRRLSEAERAVAHTRYLASQSSAIVAHAVAQVHAAFEAQVGQ
jgi:hypothetical protein